MKKPKIYTSYFGNLRYIPKNMVPIAICGSAPKWYTGLVYPGLAPTWGMQHELVLTGDRKTFVDRYFDEILEKEHPKQTYWKLIGMSQGKDVVLLCYEKYGGEFCHRHILQNWFLSYGIECDELKPEKEAI